MLLSGLAPMRMHACGQVIIRIDFDAAGARRAITFRAREPRQQRMRYQRRNRYQPSKRRNMFDYVAFPPRNERSLNVGVEFLRQLPICPL